MRRDQRSPEAQQYHRWYKLKVWLGIREAQLSSEPLCRMCKEQGLETLATHCDHIEPHKGDWLKFVHGPFQSLCWSHHSSAKQSEERLGYSKGVDSNGYPVDPSHPWGQRWGYSIPRGTQPSGIPVMLVCGPPAAGKTTYVRTHSAPGDTIIDLGECKVQCGGNHWTDDEVIWKGAYRIRDALIRSLHAKSTGTAWLIVTAPTKAERDTWERALVQVRHVILDTPAETCLARIAAEPLRKYAADAQTKAVVQWWATYTY